MKHRGEILHHARQGHDVRAVVQELKPNWGHEAEAAALRYRAGDEFGIVEAWTFDRSRDGRVVATHRRTGWAYETTVRWS